MGFDMSCVAVGPVLFQVSPPELDFVRPGERALLAPSKWPLFCSRTLLWMLVRALEDVCLCLRMCFLVALCL